MEITKGKIPGAKRIVLYGPEGIGKSTFASCFPAPVFIDTEGSTKALDVARFTADFSDWDTIIEAVKEAIRDKTMDTVVIDTLDWAEQACIRKLNKDHNTANILTLDYGKGSLYVVAEFEKLLSELNGLIEMGINVVLVAHAAMRKQELPDEMGAFDRWELKLQSKQVKAMVKEWADMVLFANYKTIVVEDDKTKSKKAQGGKRVMYTQHRPTWDAKNRYGLDECLPFVYDSISKLITRKDKKAKAEKKPDPEPVKETSKETPKEEPKEKPRPEIDELKRLMEKDGISINRLLYAVSNKTKDFSATTIEGLDPDFIRKSLIDKWDKFVGYAKKFSDKDIETMTIPFD